MEAFIKYDVEFHFSLARASGNKVLLQFLGAVTDLIRRLHQRSFSPADAPHATPSRFTGTFSNSSASETPMPPERKLIEHLTDVVKNIEKNTGRELGTAFYFMAGKRQPEEDSGAPGGR